MYIGNPLMVQDWMTTVKVNVERKTVNPYAAMNQITSETGKKSKRVTAATGESFVVEVKSEEQGRGY